MALLRDVVFKKGPTFSQLIKQEQLKVNLKAANKLIVRFDPFRQDVKEIRRFSFFINAEEIQVRSPKCSIQTEILTDRSEQHVAINLADGKNFIIKCAHLNSLEILQIINEHITPLSPEKEEETLSVAQLKKAKGRKK